MVSPISHTVTGLSHEDDPLHRGDGRGRKGRHQPRAGRTGLCLSDLDDEDEIRAFFALAKTARTRKLPVWKHLAKTIPAFDFDLSEPKAGETGVLATDKGPVIPPEFYRRYANWSARNKAKVTSQNFQKFLGEGSGGKPDTCYETGDFLANGVHAATPRNFAEFVEGGKTIKFQPEGLVSGEAPSRLVGADGRWLGSFEEHQSLNRNADIIPTEVEVRSYQDDAPARQRQVHIHPGWR
ncbi:hypothetical protein [Bradyrhizobium sp. CCBAU 53380]|uniref:hypothetical protein n=1 Tax=Bradyrhizobium sp. CCBAU 53380 TaxID=1325117 RepID=UPI00230227AF|nr:hypothetical protein [Bradyrhizobium sp. CCBAU 53380]